MPPEARDEMGIEQLEEVHREFLVRLGHLGAVVIAGGAVRDAVMGRTPKDYDVFILGCPFNAESRDAVTERLSTLPSLNQLEFHKSEPFLTGTVSFHVGGKDVVVQVMTTDAATVQVLLDRFDWNVSRFAFDGAVHALTAIDEIGTGQPLRLHKVTYPLSTLRRGFRFSERFGMEFQRSDVLRLCHLIVADENFEAVS